MKEKNLSDSLRRLIADMLPDERAKYIAKQLTTITEHFHEGAQRSHRERSRFGDSAVNAEMFEFYETILTETLASMKVLEREQWRQREAAKLFLHGAVDRHFLRRVTESWNGDTPADEQSKLLTEALGGDKHITW